MLNRVEYVTMQHDYCLKLCKWTNIFAYSFARIHDFFPPGVAAVKHFNIMFGYTARTARFSKKSPWSVFIRGEMSVMCHKITVKCG